MRKYRTIPLFVMSTSAIISSIGYGSWIFNHFQEIEKRSQLKILNRYVISKEIRPLSIQQLKRLLQLLEIKTT